MKKIDDNIVLSIVIPTLNRKILLELTLDAIVSQLVESHIPIELIVCDNASDDGTKELLCKDGRFEGVVKYFFFNDRVESNESFRRSIAQCSGHLINLFGDDDVPLPGYIRELTKQISNSPEIEIFYINRIVGDKDLNNSDEVAHPNKPYGVSKMSSNTFIRQFTHWPSFITCLIFSKEIWHIGKSEGDRFDGYDYFSRICNGSKGKDVIFIASPLVLQRRGIQSWKKFWPQYWLVSMPRLLENLEINKVTTGALATWRQKEVTSKRFLIDCFVAKAYNYPITSSFWKDSRKFQASTIRQIGSIFIQYLIPAFVAKFLYSKTNKMT